MKTKITSGFWRDRLEVNAQRAIFHQWEQLEASGCIENFPIAAGDADGFREGWFFADSDAYKWLDAASRICASFPNPQLDSVMDAFITLVARAQRPDGYIFTYNQIHFPTDRWKNLQIEHELYCHGHLIEAGVSHYEATARTDMLAIARRAADRSVEDFLGKGTNHTPGHEEIEIALLRLYKITDHQPYLEMLRARGLPADATEPALPGRWRRPRTGVARSAAGAIIPDRGVEPRCLSGCPALPGA